MGYRRYGLKVDPWCSPILIKMSLVLSSLVRTLVPTLSCMSLMRREYFLKVRDDPCSPWVILSRNFTEHCVHGWDNLPRRLLMYFANAAYSMESYFQTVICSSSDFRNTTVNGDLRFFVWDDPPGLEPRILDETHLDNMVNSSAAFARRFVEEAPVLKKVDDELLNRSSAQLVPGVWCRNLGEKQGGGDVEACSEWGDINVVRPGRAGERLRRFISEIIHIRGCTVAAAS
ncbi:unnamed protein product [Triticum turgidum subsp. durum]|uniref:Uncharacterized protein n=1 Tax=Triticum turgidum subsp. durum TaxID=4567 RepID=A0A9R1NUI1_TRITD|nr:unnamed protein product [Triticum turgidum subsp. durum]